MKGEFVMILITEHSQLEMQMDSNWEYVSWNKYDNI